MTQALRILNIEDSEDDALLIARRLRKAGYDLATRRVDCREDMVRALREEEWDLALCDHSLPNFDITSALEVIKQSGLDLPLVIVSGAIDEKSAVAAMRGGARDYVMKGNLDRLIPVIERELLSRQIRAQKSEAESALAAQIKFLQDLIETIPAAIFYKDKDGNYLGCNKSFVRWLGKGHKDEIKGHTIFDLVPPTEAYQHNQMDQELLERGGSSIYETSLENSEGTPRHFMVHKAAFDDSQGNHGGIVGVLLDITNLKEAEETRKELEGQLRQAQKLEAIGTLAGGIAHDFNNILAAIFGYTELAQAQLGNQDKVAKYLSQILLASERAKSLIKQILTFSRKAEQEVQPVSVGLIAKEALKLLRASLPPTIEMIINIDSNAGMVLADPTQVHQIIMNLCTNASHAMKAAGGILTVEVRPMEIAGGDSSGEFNLEPGAYLDIKVSDTGHGMAPSTLERIFDPYFTTKPVGEGTGLGLSVVHGIIKGMGGDINVHSQPGQGTEFSLLIPRIEPEDEAAGLSTLSGAVGGTERIMVVDDEEAVTDIISSQLGKIGYKVAAFKSGDDAWEYFQRNPGLTDAVITDYLMAGINGAELAERIKSANNKIPIIIHTGFNECLVDEDGSQNGADAVCLKPIHAADLANVLRELLNKYQSR